MKVHFTDNDVLVIRAKDSVEAMALKYWLMEYREHGDKVLEVDATVPIELPDKS